MTNVEIFTGPGCAHCETAKALLRKHKVPFREYDISDPEMMALLLARLPRVRSIPQIFANGDHLGNDEDLRLNLS